MAMLVDQSFFAHTCYTWKWLCTSISMKGRYAEVWWPPLIAMSLSTPQCHDFNSYELSRLCLIERCQGVLKKPSVWCLAKQVGSSAPSLQIWHLGSAWETTHAGAKSHWGGVDQRIPSHALMQDDTRSTNIKYIQISSNVYYFDLQWLYCRWFCMGMTQPIELFAKAEHAAFLTPWDFNTSFQLRNDHTRPRNMMKHDFFAF